MDRSPRHPGVAGRRAPRRAPAARRGAVPARCSSPAPPPAALSGFRQAENVYGTTAHHRKTPNGYSGYFPPSWVKLSKEMRALPDEQTLAHLRDLGVRYVVVRGWARGGGMGRVARPRAAPARCSSSDATATTCCTRCRRPRGVEMTAPASTARRPQPADPIAPIVATVLGAVAVPARWGCTRSSRSCSCSAAASTPTKGGTSTPAGWSGAASSPTATSRFPQMPLTAYAYGLAQLVKPSLYLGRLTSFVLRGRRGGSVRACRVARGRARSPRSRSALLCVAFPTGIYNLTLTKTYAPHRGAPGRDPLRAHVARAARSGRGPSPPRPRSPSRSPAPPGSRSPCWSSLFCLLRAPDRRHSPAGHRGRRWPAWSLLVAFLLPDLSAGPLQPVHVPQPAVARCRHRITTSTRSSPTAPPTGSATTRATCALVVVALGAIACSQDGARLPPPPARRRGSWGRHPRRRSRCSCSPANGRRSSTSAPWCPALHRGHGHRGRPCARPARRRDQRRPAWLGRVRRAASWSLAAITLVPSRRERVLHQQQ